MYSDPYYVEAAEPGKGHTKHGRSIVVLLAWSNGQYQDLNRDQPTGEAYSSRRAAFAGANGTEVAL